MMKLIQRAALAATIAATLTAGLNLAAIERTPLQGARVYITPMNGFEDFLSAAMISKHVPIEIVSDREQADFEMTGTTQSQKAGWAKVIFTKSIHSDEEASIVVRNIKTGQVVYAYAVNKSNSVHGKQSTAEACAKHLKQAIEKEL
jgi:hypothetical protein